MKNKNEDGSIIVEATIYYPVIILVVGVVIVISLMKLQQCLVMATLISSVDLASMEAMDEEDVLHELDTIDAFISSVSVVKGRNRIVNIQNSGSIVRTINVKLEYKIEVPGFIKMITEKTSVGRMLSGSGPVADITALTVDPRYMVDTMDQHILFRSNGSCFGNLMLGKYSMSFYTYLYKQYSGY